MSDPARKAVLLVAPTPCGGAWGTTRVARHVERQRGAVAAALERRGVEIGPVLAVVEEGQETFDAELAAVIGSAVEAGATRLVAIPLAPQYSSAVAVVADALGRARASIGRLAPEVDLVSDWHDSPRLLGALTSAAYEALDAVWSFNSSERANVDWALGSKMATPVVFVGPAWPPLEAPAPEGDPYPKQLEETARSVAERLDLHAWSVARLAVEPGQSSPELAERIRDLASRQETDVVVCPVGSVADDEWLLHAVDVEGQRLADELGIHLDRARSLNDDPTFVAALADLVVSRLE